MNTEQRLSELGFGMMRPPMQGEEADIPQLCRMVDAYMEKGFNYFDTAYGYCGGKSESFTGEVVVKRYPREAFRLATKLPRWELKCKEDRDRVFNEQLRRTGAEYFDYYLLHAVGDGDSYNGYMEYDCFNWLAQKKKEGKVRKIGFSFHGTPELLEEILSGHPEIEFVQIQLNYADWDNPLIQSRRQYEILRKFGVEILIMEPVKGGTLANVSAEVEAKMQAVRPGESPASWALRYTASLEGVTIILSGMSNQEQVEDNLKTFATIAPLSAKETGVIEAAAQALIANPAVACTSCQYCVDGCPQNIQIPLVFNALSSLRMYGENKRAHSYYGKAIEDKGRASDCIACGQCEEICPQRLPIIELLGEASQRLDVESMPE